MSKQTLEQIRASRKRWQAKLTRAVNAIRKLDKAEHRLCKPRLPISTEQVAVVTIKPSAPVGQQIVKVEEPTLDIQVNGRNALISSTKRLLKSQVTEPKVSLEVLSTVVQPAPKPERVTPLDIPEFLQRTALLKNAADVAAAEAIKAEKAEHAKAKAKGQAAKRKAQRSGETRKMPLQGKAALAKINASS